LAMIAYCDLNGITLRQVMHGHVSWRPGAGI
jgi:hypothetical protein